MEEKLRQSIEDGYKQYLTIHPRSNKKVYPIHKTISEIILSKLGNDFTIKSMGIDDDKEFELEGKYYSKNSDITILYKNKPISGIGVKFITSNYKQNSNNYFENMLGETANIKRANFLYAQIIIFKYKIPYYSSDKKTFTKIEQLNEKNIQKYVKLHNDNISSLYHKPDLMFITFVETGDEIQFQKIINSSQIINKNNFHKEILNDVKVKFIKSDKLKLSFSPETLEFIEKTSNFENFITAFVNLTKGKIYGI